MRAWVLAGTALLAVAGCAPPYDLRLPPWPHLPVGGGVVEAGPEPSIAGPIGGPTPTDTDTVGPYRPGPPTLEEGDSEIGMEAAPAQCATISDWRTRLWCREREVLIGDEELAAGPGMGIAPGLLGSEAEVAASAAARQGGRTP